MPMVHRLLHLDLGEPLERADSNIYHRLWSCLWQQFVNQLRSRKYIYLLFWELYFPNRRTLKSVDRHWQLQLEL